MLRMVGVDERLVACATATLKRAPMDLTIPRYGGWRSVEDQQNLYYRGRTKSGRIVTNCDGIRQKSMHQRGLALDIVVWDGYRKRPIWPTADSDEWVAIKTIMYEEASRMGISITWGGDWVHFPDRPHWEIDEG